MAFSIFSVAGSAHAGPLSLSGAIFTTVADGSEVNFNVYPSMDAVYLDGGPGPGAPQGAAALPDGIYVFQVTDPSGKTLLSTDNPECRQFTVTNGIITSVDPSPASCKHKTGLDIDHGATTVQLMPYNTNLKQNEYKVWATPIGDYPSGCLTTPDCSSGVHGFTPSDSKTDNFKIGGEVKPEIDTRFWGEVTGDLLDGRSITHVDTLGASDVKWSYLDVSLDVNHEAHVEAPEIGTHQIVIDNQTGCTVDNVTVYNTQTGKSYSTGVVGPQTVSVTISPSLKSGTTIFVDVNCVGL